MKNIITLIGFLISTVFITMALTACPAPYHDTEEAQPAKRVFIVKGDPDELIRGAKLQTSSPITEENLQEWNNYTLLTMHFFSEKEEDPKTSTPTNKEQIEKENSTKDSTKISQPDLYQIKTEKNENGQWQIRLLSGALGIRLKADTQNHLQPYLIFTEKISLPLQVVHWSISKDENFISLLARTDGDIESGKALIAFYFQRKKNETKIETIDEKYVYLAGPGQKIRWKLAPESNLEINLCGSSEHSEKIKESFESWNQHLKERLPLKYEQTNNFAPFSDLNQHCIYIVDSYINEIHSNLVNYGITSSVLSIIDAKFVDSDVFIFKSEFEKIYKEAIKQGYIKELAASIAYKDFPYSITHELGHLLGLGHKFDKETTSVMSYDFGAPQPRQYDVEAIQELYPLIKPVEVKQ